MRRRLYLFFVWTAWPGLATSILAQATVEGAVKVYCEIHEYMRATILVLETPYFVKTDPTGKFRMENLPTGSFTLKAWLDEKIILERTVELKNGATLHVDFKRD